MQSPPIPDTPVPIFPDQPMEVAMASSSSSATITRAYEEPFRLNSKQLFLTYDHCLIPKERVLELLREKFTIIDYVVAEELHQDGTPHIHCYLKLSRKVNIKDPHFLDLLDPETGLRAAASSPEEAYQGCRSPTLVWNYVRKGKKYISNMKAPPTSDVYTEALKTASGGNVSSALRLLEKKAPRDFLLNKDKFVKTLIEQKARFPVVNHSISEYPAWNDEWWSRKTKTLIIIGSPGVGKTELAKALLPRACFMKSIEGLKDYVPLAHEGFILDDVKIAERDIAEQVNILDLLNDTNIRILYRTMMMPHGTPRIITCHVPDIMAIADFYDGAVRRRCDMVNVGAWDKMEKVDIDKLVASMPPPALTVPMGRRRAGGKFSGGPFVFPSSH